MPHGHASQGCRLGRRSRVSLVWLSLALAASALPVAASAQLSLATVVDLAQRNSSAVKLAGADVSKAIKVLEEAKDVYIPNLTLGSSIGPPSIGFTFSQPSIASATMQSLAFSFPQRQYIESARRGIDAAVLSLKEAREQAALEASTEYVELDTLSQELETGQQQATYSERLLQIEQERQQAGIDSFSDVLQARLRIAQLKLSRIHLQSRAATLIGQLSALTGMPATSIQTMHSSIPEIPAVQVEPDFKAAATSATSVGGMAPLGTPGIAAAQMQAKARQFQTRGDFLSTSFWPQIAFGAQYNRDATSLNNYNTYFSAKKKFKADNFNAGFSILIPIYDVAKRDRARQSAVESLRATIEAEQAQRQNDIQIATLTGSIRELDALAEVAGLKQQIASEQLKTVLVEMQSGNGAGTDPGAPPQLSPKAEQLARIDERQKYMDALDAGFDLSRARLSLLRALGHMEDWLHEVSGK